MWSLLGPSYSEPHPLLRFLHKKPRSERKQETTPTPLKLIDAPPIRAPNTYSAVPYSNSINPKQPISLCGESKPKATRTVRNAILWHFVHTGGCVRVERFGFVILGCPSPVMGGRPLQGPEKRALGRLGRRWGLTREPGNGGESRLRERFGESKTDVAKKLADRISELDGAASGPTTVGELCEQWLVRSAPKRKSERSLLTDRRPSELHVLPRFGRVKLVALTVEDVEEWLDAVGGRCGTGTTCRPARPCRHTNGVQALSASGDPNDHCDR